MASLSNFDAEQFLATYWQRQPLLIRQGLHDTQTLISPDELAGLACEESMESRLISYAQRHWALRHGPFTEHDFSQLPATDWTLLVQAVDHVSPEIAGLMDYFRFIPNWRLDDIMVSYACEGGSVGPHYDNYDVFLIQTSGRREWQIGQRCDERSPLLEHDDLRLLDTFDCQQRLVLEPGDILYIPPGYSHWGTAKDNECITCSVGFRAPSVADIVGEFADHLAQASNSSQRFKDQQPRIQANPGEITPQVIDQLKQLVARAVDQPEALEHWFGQYMTQVKYPLADQQTLETEASTLDKLTAGALVVRDPASRFAYIDKGAGKQLFINGGSWQLAGDDAKLAELLCGQSHFQASVLLSWFTPSHCRKLLVTLFEQGSLYFDDD